jgi:hypothetical protein
MNVSDSSTPSRLRRLARLSACGAAALAFPAVAAAQASAATIAVPAACVVVDPHAVKGSPMIVQGAGFTPGDLIELTTNTGSGLGTATADVSGQFTATITAPLLPSSGPREASYVLTALDQTDDVTTAATTFVAANLAVAAKPAKAKPGKKVTFTFSGFTSGAKIYGHYLHRKKLVTTERMGTASGPCGLLKTRATLFPKRARFQNYNIQYDDSARYSKTAVPRLIATLTTFSF